ncbi:hypothetical protein [Streptomyces lucensis]|uniref:hypothetical protein n=1 Tax=Streptomyces lucensis TaxID=67319 RepID=UPI00167341F6|nr:hypothetical protein [Streptomyces lucensis]
MNQQDRILHAWGDAPIYDKLIVERGHIPAQVNTEAARILKDAERSIDFGPRLPYIPL